jgi:hypothetical protein
MKPSNTTTERTVVRNRRVAAALWLNELLWISAKRGGSYLIDRFDAFEPALRSMTATLDGIRERNFGETSK